MNMGVLIWIFHWFIIVFLIKIAMIGENPTFSSIFGHTLFLPVYPAKHVFFVKVGRVCASSMWQQHLWHSFLTSGKVRGRFYVGVVGCSHLKRNHSWDSWKCSSSYKWTYIYTLYIAHIYIYHHRYNISIPTFGGLFHAGCQRETSTADPPDHRSHRFTQACVSLVIVVYPNSLEVFCWLCGSVN